MSKDRRLGPGVSDREKGTEQLTGSEVIDGLLIVSVLTVAIGRFAIYKVTEKAGSLATRIGTDLNRISEKGVESATRDLRDALGRAKGISG